MSSSWSERRAKLRADNARLRAALEKAKEFADDEFSDCEDLPRKSRIYKLCDEIDGALAISANERKP